MSPAERRPRCENDRAAWRRRHAAPHYLPANYDGSGPLSGRDAPRHYLGSAPASVAIADETGASGFDAAAVDFDDDMLRFGSDANTAPTDEPAELTTVLAAAAPVVSSEPVDTAVLPNALLPDVTTLPVEASAPR